MDNVENNPQHFRRCRIRHCWLSIMAESQHCNNLKGCRPLSVLMVKKKLRFKSKTFFIS